MKTSDYEFLDRVETKIQALPGACITWFRKPAAVQNLALLLAWDFTRLVLKETL